MEAHRPQRKFIRMGAVLDKVGLSRSQIYKLIAEDQFPKQIGLGGRSVAWSEEEVEGWMEQRLMLSRSTSQDTIRTKWATAFKEFSPRLSRPQEH